MESDDSGHSEKQFDRGIKKPKSFRRRKIVAVGDEDCGKTCLLSTYSRGSFPTTYVPKVLEDPHKTFTREHDGNIIEITLVDTVADGHYERLRPLSYPDTHLFLVCFALDRPESLQSVLDKWCSELYHFALNIPRLLVGLKSDLRDNQVQADVESSRDTSFVTSEQGRAVAQRTKCSYIECSAKSGWNVQEVFDKALENATVAQKHTHPICNIL